VNLAQARAAMSHCAFCGLSRGHLGELVTELAPRWEARCESGRRQRRRDDRRRQAGAGPKYELLFTDRLLVTLVHLRTGLTHEALGVIYSSRSFQGEMIMAGWMQGGAAPSPSGNWYLGDDLDGAGAIKIAPAPTKPPAPNRRSNHRRQLRGRPQDVLSRLGHGPPPPNARAGGPRGPASRLTKHTG